MKNKDEERKIDPNLDIPSEANTTKHINFLDVENESSGREGKNKDDSNEERRKQWERGLEEGKQDREK
jgi:hypothetical protein